MTPTMKTTPTMKMTPTMNWKTAGVIVVALAAISCSLTLVVVFKDVRSGALSIKTTPLSATNQTKPSLSKCLARSAGSSLDSGSCQALGSKANQTRPWTRALGSKANRARPWIRALGSKANRTRPWTRTPLGSKANRTRPWTRALGSKANRARPWTRAIGPAANRARRSSALKSDSGLDSGSVCFLGCM
jgi:hypothetical protein